MPWTTYMKSTVKRKVMQKSQATLLLHRATISDAEFSGKLRVWRESTSTSPSGMHLGHCKALVARHSFSTTTNDSDLTPHFIERRDEINRKQAAIRYVRLLTLINNALERGYSYRRWQTIVNSVLFKDPDNVRLHRTRIIHIYEADFNLAMGLKWRVATQQAEDLKALNKGQYGSRTGRSAIEPVSILKRCSAKFPAPHENHWC